MKKSFTTTLVLLGCFVLLLGWYIGYEKNFRSDQDRQEEKAKELISLDRTSITEIVLLRAKNVIDETKGHPTAPAEITTIALKKNGADWNIVEPIQYQADNSQIDALVTTAVSTKYERVVDDKPKDLEEFGLKTPLIKATFKKDATTSQTLLIGKDTPTGNSVYVKIEGKDPVYRVSRVVRTTYEKPLSDLRDKTVLNTQRNQLVEVEIQLPKKQSIVVKRDDKDNWTLLREGLPADSTEWSKTLNSTLDAKAKDFPQGKDLKKFGLQPPAAKVVLQKSDKSKVTLLVGRVGDKQFAKREDKDTIFEIDNTLLTKLERPGADYIDKHVAPFNRFDTARLRLTRPNGVLEMVKDTKESTWTVVAKDVPAGKQTMLEKGKLDTMLTALQDMKAEKYLKGHAGITSPTLKLELWETTSKANEPKLTLSFKPDGKNIIGQRLGVETPFAISPAEFAKINVSEKDLAKETKPAPEVKKSAAQPTEKRKS